MIECIFAAMVRRSKEDALATRNSLLDAAERAFLAQGVAGTSLNDIAVEAGTTRGAIYWHFRDKADLFNAMMQRVVMPLQFAMASTEEAEGQEAIALLRAGLRTAFHQTATDPHTRRVFEIATQRVEYVDSLCEVRARLLEMRDGSVARFRDALIRGARARGLRLPFPAAQAAQGLQALVDGLIQNWLLDASAFDLEKAGVKAVDAYLRGLGFD